MTSTAAADTSNLDQLLRVLRRRWLTLLTTTILVCAAATALSLHESKRYTATASLLFQQDQFDQALFGANFTPSAQDPQADQATNVDLAGLPIVKERTRQALKSQGGLQGASIAIQGVGQSNIVQVAVTSTDPVVAARIANTYVQQFVVYRQQADKSKITAARTLVNKELAELPASQKYGSIGTSLQERSQQLGVLAALQTGDAQVAQPASVPHAASAPDNKRNALLGLILGLLIGTGLVFLLERLDKRIRGAAELEAAYEMPVLGVVPESHAYELAGTEPLPAIEAEAVALLRARLRYFNVDREIRSLLMTSAGIGEGKTTIALNLAIAEAVAGNERMVLLEADLRRPTLAKRLSLDPSAGVSEILSRNASLDDCINTVEVPTSARKSQPTVSVITAGAIPPNPAELIESRAMIDLLSALGERFDMVIIDTAPTTAVSDAIPLLRLVSGVIVVNRVDRITRDDARNLRDQLRNLGAPVLGVVANAAIAHRDGYRYGYGYETNAYLTEADPTITNGHKPAAATEPKLKGSTRPD